MKYLLPLIVIVIAVNLGVVLFGWDLVEVVILLIILFYVKMGKDEI